MTLRSSGRRSPAYRSRSNYIAQSGSSDPDRCRLFMLSAASVSREARIRTALEKKLPKLTRWKQDFNARTVLVFEQNDIQLTNVHLVTDALLKAETSAREIADEVYLVTSTISPWWVHFVRVDFRTYFDLTDPDDRAWEIDPSSLSAITESAA